MNTLSARRRHPLAAFVVLFFALAFIGAAYATLGSSTANASAASGVTQDQLTAGQKLFQSSCSSCHNMNGQGVQGSGPSLIGVGAAAVDFQVGTGRMPAMQIGPQVPSKPPIFSPEQIADMAAYIGSLGAGPDIPDPSLYNADPNNAASVSNGGVLFRTNCSQCHNVAGAGGALTDGKYAPSLRDTSPKHLYEAMLTGPQNMPVFNDNVMSPQDKKDIIAYLLQTRTGANPGGLDLGSIGPVSEGLFVWTIVLGLLIVFACWIGAHTTKASRARVAHFEATTGKDATDND
ncbi:cytochrome c class I [Catenulispora acidiphila DSM 44928]|uniref:Cytochrome bc1 complex cytochrome c subunit n=1 Tax=Catenulispora acidiphila (strain DSM 44928 / JCM 14897 / NBRC 102108 / NRRL B-24433 / ID139908) TaxID=479433 RepID=C7QBM2_CATAD|nr:c-type cytochrome [Catenulispora acidiphila]ACU70599.1 cytochrome c class I [Catenulispora acidiphila DSM 44928]